MEMDQENNNSGKSNSSERKRCYRDLLNRIERLQESDDVGIHAVQELGDILEEANLIDGQCDIDDRVQYADETLLDSVVLSSASEILVKCLENLDIFTSTYEPTEFATKIVNAIKDPEEEELLGRDWLKLLEDARAIVPELPHYSFLYGTFDPTKFPEPKQRKERSRREAQENVEKKQLQRVNVVEKDEEGTDDTVNFLKNVLFEEYKRNDSEPIAYFDFVIDSENFASTVENMFYCSFLVRDGKAKLDVGEDGLPTLQPMHKRDLTAFRNDGGVNVQMISSITMEDWEVLRVKEGFIQKHKKLLKPKT